MAQAQQNPSSELRPFTKVDWYGYAGCERWADGVEPRISEVQLPGWPDAGNDPDGVVLVVDSQGVELSGCYVWLAYRVPATDFATPAAHRQVVEDLARMILTARPNYTTLQALGFQEG